MERYSLVLLRIGMGWMLLWAFFDKLLGLGFATAPNKAWLAGGSPTSGFLTFGTQGPFKIFFEALSGNMFVDWLFMLGLFCIGSALLLGIGMKIATHTGVLMMFLLWLALLPPKNNPFLDEHIIYILVFLVLQHTGAGKWFSLEGWWSKTKLVKQNSILR